MPPQAAFYDGMVSHSDRAALARLEVAVSAVVRWSESRPVKAEVARRSGCDLSGSELRLLEHFDVAEPMRVSDIAECLNIDMSTVSLQLRRLRADGLVTRIPDPNDRRVSLIAITDAGRAAVAQVRATRRDLLQDILSGTDPAELDRAADVLLRVQEHMLDGMRATLGLTHPH
ncbi:MarR family winged helix-turn-helix transcriptional regulator [Nonomuraea sp. AD125B]|uniref:MarR family winged helix-turn-helix transcriptional regulator n=1 Tax=Nonomuraea TaxID=83681 RepID=UPI0031DBDDF8